jgi:serine/threonine protein kinase
MIVERPSDRDYACFFCGKGQSKDLTATCPECAKPFDIGPMFEGKKVGNYVLMRYINRGYYGATYYAENPIRKGFAVKITPRILYTHHEKSFDEEIQKYRQLGNHPNIAELIDAGEAEVTADLLPVPIYYIVTEWIEGQTLTEFIKRQQLSVNEMYGVILDMFSGIARFERKNLWHNDLNSDNILVKPLTVEELETRSSESQFICKIVDIGSAVFRQAERHKILDDVKFMGQHINAMCTVLLQKPSLLTKEDRYFLNELGKVVAHILDEDPARAVNRAKTALDEVKALYARRLLFEQEESVELTDPFAYLNANEFPTEAYINLLFSDQFPWLKSIVSPDIQPILITGPRGSGKTMILKSMRLRTKLNKQTVDESSEKIKERVSSEKLAGFFVSARIDIGNNCPLTKLPAWASNEEQVNLYFNLLYGYEIIDSIYFGMSKGLIEVPSEAERTISSFICDLLENGRVGSFGGLLSTISGIQHQIIANNYSKPVKPGIVGPAFLTNITALIKERIPFFQKKSVVFLLDDFAFPKVPEAIQQMLLPIVWNSGGGYAFRVTAHSESTALQDIKGVFYLPNREYTEINLGASYIDNMDLEKKIGKIKRCINDILKKRFALNPNFQGKSIETIIGEGKKTPIAEEIKKLNQEKKLESLNYYGWNTIIRLCSGDISYIIDILRGIFRDPTQVPITKIAQNREIRGYARRELYRLQDYSVASCNFYEVASNFGKMSLFKLLRKDVGKEKRPAEYLRIEVQIDGLSPHAKEALVDLLRNGVFIDGGFSSSAQKTPARRIIFKKLFTPAFPTTYNSRDTLPMSAKHFSDFITDPKKYIKSVMGEYGIPPEQQSFELEKLMPPYSPKSEK